MLSWFRRRPASSPRALGRRATQATKVDFAELAPPPDEFLGQVAYAQLAFFQFTSELARRTDSLEDTESMSTAAGHALAVHHGLVAEIERRGGTATAAMAPYVERTDRLLASVQGSSGLEGILSAHIVFEFLDDFYISLARGLDDDAGVRAASIIGAERTGPGLAEILRRRIDEEPRRAHLLALWGRRLVGDTMLFAHSMLGVAGPGGEERVEPVFTELIATHTRRMDALGLTA